MPGVVIWTLEYDNDRDTVKLLAEKLTKHLQLENISIRAVGKLKNKNIKDARYHERMSPGIAEHIEINDQTLRRNSSFQKLGDLLEQCDSLSLT